MLLCTILVRLWELAALVFLGAFSYAAWCESRRNKTNTRLDTARPGTGECYRKESA